MVKLTPRQREILTMSAKFKCQLDGAREIKTGQTLVVKGLITMDHWFNAEATPAGRAAIGGEKP